MSGDETIIGKSIHLTNIPMLLSGYAKPDACCVIGKDKNPLGEPAKPVAQPVQPAYNPGYGYYGGAVQMGGY